MNKTNDQSPTTTTTTTNAHPQPAWHVRFPGATPDRVTVEPAWSRYPEELHIVGVGSRDVVHGRWGSKLYHTWDEAIAASIELQEAKIRQLETDAIAARDHLRYLRSLTEPTPNPTH